MNAGRLSGLFYEQAWEEQEKLEHEIMLENAEMYEQAALKNESYVFIEKKQDSIIIGRRK